MPADALGLLYAARRLCWLDRAGAARGVEDAEDAVHDACLRALFGVSEETYPTDRYDDDEFVSALVHGAVRLLRRRNRRRGLTNGWGEVLDDGGATPLALRVAVQRAVDRLRQVSHPAVWRCLAQGESLQGVASSSGLTIQTLRTQLERARRELVRTLAPYRILG